jgi:hypothetical protein
MMTSLASIAGTAPLALGIGPGAEVRSPMGIAVMGGFTTSTLLTLLVVPVLFTYIDNLQHWITQLPQRGFGRKHGRRNVGKVALQTGEDKNGMLLGSRSEGADNNEKDSYN